MSDRDTSGSPETAPARDINPNDLHAVADTLPDDALDFDDGDTEDTSAAPNEPRRREAPQEPQDGDEAEEPATEAEDDGSDAGEAAEGEEGANDAEDGPEPKAKTDEKSADFIEIDGHKLTADEIRRGYQRQADYTRKTQALAEQVREFEAVRSQTEAERGEIQTILNVSLEVLRARMPQPPSKDLIRTDPMGYMEKSEAYNEAVAQVNQLLGAQQHLGQKQTAEQQAAAKKQEAEAAERESRDLEQRREAALAVQQTHPHLFTDKGWNDLRQGVSKHSKLLGLDLDAFSQIIDPRAFPVIELATKYLDLQAAKPTVEERIKAAPPIRAAVRQAPGTRNGEAHKRAMDRLRREGTVEAAAATLDDSIFD